MSEFIEQALAEHDAVEAAKAAERIAVKNGAVEFLLLEILQQNAVAQAGFATVAGVEFTANDGKLYVVHRCPECGFTYRSLKPVYCMADVGAGLKDDHRLHPCQSAQPVTTIDEGGELPV